MEGIFQFALDAIVLIALLAAVYFFIVADPAKGYKEGVRRIAGTAAVLLAIGLFAVLSAVIVPPGHVAVVAEFGRVQSEELPPGLHFRLPFVNSVTVVDTRVQGIKFDKLGAASREYQDVILTGTLNVHVDPTKASEIIQTIGLDYSAKIVVPFYANLVKEVVPKYTIDQVLPNREAIRKETVEKLTAKLLAYGIIVDDIAIENISFSEAYTAAIEAKQIAQQQVETEKQVTQQRIQQAQQAIEAAKGNAQAAIENAKGQAEANRLLTESLSELLVRYQSIIKLNPNVQVIYLPSDANLFIPAPAVSPAP
jgi:regulator of protease activity HflC (stomatin/prohibitin superfamily)